MGTTLSTAAKTTLNVSERSLRRIDKWLVLSALALIFVGLMSLYSIDHDTGSRWFKSQLVRLALGIVPFLFFYYISPAWLRRMQIPIYILNGLLLLMVLKIGNSSGGATRWISFGPLEFQPSELAKILTVITLANFFENRREIASTLGTFLLSLAHVSVPLLLILKQPHLGGALVIFVIWLCVGLVAYVPARYVLIMVGVVVAYLAVGIANPKLGLVKPYHIERFEGMFGSKTSDQTFQVDRALVAFGLGGVEGAGFLKGEQKSGKFVPEQETDMVLTVMGEEGGFIGTVLVLCLFGFFFYRVWLVFFHSEDPYTQMVAAGIFGILVFHTVVNVAMNLALFPVVGLWLPFISFGGTALWLCMACVGLLLNLRRRERPVLF